MPDMQHRCIVFIGPSLPLDKAKLTLRPLSFGPPSGEVILMALPLARWSASLMDRSIRLWR